MKENKAKSRMDPVQQAEQWKNAVDRETKGMNEQKLNKYFEKEIELIIHKYRLKAAQ